MTPFVPPMLPSLTAEPPAGGQWIHELKLDGYRLQAHCSRGDCQLFTRQGVNWTDRFKELAAALAPLTSKRSRSEFLILDGEAVAVDADGRSDFSALQQYLKSDRSTRFTLAYFAFDLLHHGKTPLLDQPLLQRKEQLRTTLSRSNDARLQFLSHVERGEPLLQQCRTLQLEGIVSKRIDRPYRSGRTTDWLKCKCRFRERLILGGIEIASTGKHLSSLLLGYFRDDNSLAFAGRVGTGWSESQARELIELAERNRQTASPFATAVPNSATRRSHDVSIVWTRPQHVVEVAFTGWTHGQVLRQPVWLSSVPDHAAADVTEEAILGDQASAPEISHKLANRGVANYRSSTKPEMTSRKATVSDGLAARLQTAGGLKISHPERVLYPDAGITKEQFISYLIQVSQWLLPHLTGRPVSFVRCPEGIDGSHYFQRHPQRGFPDAIKELELPGEAKRYLTIDSVEGLIAAGQMSVLEFHPWGCRSDRLDRPDRMVLDLDPDPEVPWRKVTSAAEEIRERLAERKIACWLKTTGGKGLHIVVPLHRRHSWGVVLQFAESIAKQMAADQPSSYVATMSKAARKGRIYIDYHRNHPHATAVGAYSPRARPGGPVSAPISWQELPKILSGNQFTLENLPQRLRELKADPWAEMFKSPQTLRL